MLLFECSTIAVESKLVKVETSLTSILHPMLSALWSSKERERDRERERERGTEEMVRNCKKTFSLNVISALEQDSKQILR